MVERPVSAPTAAEQRPRLLKVLLWLRWILLLRTYNRNRKNLLGLAFTALIFGPISIGAATFVYLYGHDSPGAALLISRAALAVIYVIWIGAPLLGFPLNGANDPSRLFVYPVPLRTILAAGVLGSVIEPTTLLAIPVCIAVAALFCHSALSTIIAVAAVTLFMLHTLAAAQFILLSLIGLLQSRRFRDVTIVLLPLIAVVAYVGRQLVAQRIIGGSYEAYALAGLWRIVDLFPPGWAAHACADAVDGRYLPAFGLASALAAAVIVPIPLAAAALGRLYRGERGSLPGGARVPATARRGLSSAPASSAGAAAEFGGGDVAALARKERIYLAREPQYKALAVNAVYTISVILFGFGVGFGRHGNAADDLLRQAQNTIQLGGVTLHLLNAILIARALLIPSLLLLATTQLVFNIFGGEGSAITVLLTLPTPRLKIIFAKNLVYAPILMALGLIGVVASVVILHTADLLALELAWVVMAALVVVGVGNLVSVRFPMRMIVRGQRSKSGGNVAYGGARGCAYAYLQTFCYIGALAMLAPAAGAFILPPALGHAGLLWLTVPIALAYAGIIYVLATRWAASMLVRREPDMIASLVADE